MIVWLFVVRRFFFLWFFIGIIRFNVKFMYSSSIEKVFIDDKIVKINIFFFLYKFIKLYFSGS